MGIFDRLRRTFSPRTAEPAPFVLTDVQQLTPDEFDRLRAARGVPEPVLRSFLELLTLRQVPADRLDSTLREMAEQYDRLRQQLEALASDDPVVHALEAQAVTALSHAAWRRVESLLNDAAAQSIRAAEGAPEDARHNRLLSAAAANASNGNLKESQLLYREAVGYYRHAVELVPAGEDAVLAGYLVSLGHGLILCGDDAGAEGPLTRALAIRERDQNPEALGRAECLYYVGWLYHNQGRYAEAEPLDTRCLAIREKVLGPEHPATAATLNNLALLYKHQGRYAEAEPLYTRVLAISEKVLGPEHPATAVTPNNLAGLYHAQRRYAEAEPLFTAMSRHQGEGARP